MTDTEPLLTLDMALQLFQAHGADLDQYLAQRTRGWANRSDSPWTGDDIRTKPGWTGAVAPQQSRYTKIQQQLETSMFNGDWELVDTASVDLDDRTFRCVDLFAGCGGLTLGFEQAGYEARLGVEVDRDSSATYKRAFPEAEVWAGLIEDLSAARARELIGTERLHVLAAGFPCQGFSVAGQRNPKDERNVLFREVIRLAEELQPWFIVLENVPGVVTMSKGTVFQAIKDEFAEIGYPGMSTLVLEAARYGVPQFRPRAVFVGNRFGLANPYPRPLLRPDEYVPIEAAIDDLKHRDRDLSINHDWTHHSAKMEKRIRQVPPGGSLYESYRDAWKRQWRGLPVMTVKENHGAVHIHHELDRTLSARELARLQGFPDSFLFAGRMKRAMFQIGNAVPPPLARHVAHALRPTLSELQDSESVGDTVAA